MVESTVACKSSEIFMETVYERVPRISYEVELVMGLYIASLLYRESFSKFSTNLEISWNKFYYNSSMIRTSMIFFFFFFLVARFTVEILILSCQNHYFNEFVHIAKLLLEL